MNKNFLYVMAGLVLGIVLGVASYYSFPDKATAFEVAKYMSLISTIFLKLIKMIIGPLVFSTLVVGIGHMGDAATVGRVGAKTMGWFICASIVSLLLGLFMVNVLQPGAGIVIADQSATTANLSTRHSASRISSTTWCRPRSSRRWPTARSCRSSCSRSSPVSPWWRSASAASRCSNLPTTSRT